MPGVVAINSARDAAAALEGPAQVRHLFGQHAIELPIAGAERRVGEVEGIRHHLPPQALVEMDQRVVDIDLEQAADRLDRIGRRRRHEGRTGGAHLLSVERHQRQQQIALGGEVVVDCPGGEFRAFGDLLDAGGREAIAFEQRSRGVKDVAPPPGLLSFAQSGHGSWKN